MALFFYHKKEPYPSRLLDNNNSQDCSDKGTRQNRIESHLSFFFGQDFLLKYLIQKNWIWNDQAGDFIVNIFLLLFVGVSQKKKKKMKRKCC